MNSCIFNIICWHLVTSVDIESNIFTEGQDIPKLRSGLGNIFMSIGPIKIYYLLMVVMP